MAGHLILLRLSVAQVSAMVGTLEERLSRERAMEKGFPARFMTIYYLLNSEVLASEDFMSKSFPGKTMVLGRETYERGGPRKAASKLKRRAWLDRAQ
jgi:hypothetical protein